MPTPRTVARIGDLVFTNRYSNPNVDVDMSTNIVEKNTITDEQVIQNLGKKADRIHIDGIIPESQIKEFDDLISGGVTTVRTHRWSGTAMVESTSADQVQGYDPVLSDEDQSAWLYSVRIDLIEVEEVPSRAHGATVTEIDIEQTLI